MHDEGSKLLEPDEFQFVLDGELRRAVRTRTSLTLITMKANPELRGPVARRDDEVMEQVARVIGREVRDTDLLGHTEQGLVSLVLLDTDLAQSTLVIDRLLSTVHTHEFPAPLRIAVGAASYPTDAVDAESLKHKALTHPVANWRARVRASRDHN